MTHPDKGTKKSLRRLRGWTDRQRVAHLREMKKMEPAALFSLRAPPLPRQKVAIPEGHRGTLRKVDSRIESAQITKATVRREMAWLKRTLWSHHTHYVESCWMILTLERQPGPGWHFHVTLSAEPSTGFVEAVRRSWLKRVSALPEEGRRCCHFRKTWKSAEHLRNYVCKAFDRRGNDPKPDMRFMGEMGQFKPWATIGRKTAESCQRHNREAENHNDGAPRRYEIEPDCNGSKSVSVPLPSLNSELAYSGNVEAEPACNKSPSPVRIGVRIFPLFGKGDGPLPPSPAWMSEHLSALRDRWEIEPATLRHPGPSYHAHALEAVFRIPVGQVRNFEHEAAGEFARVFRP